MKTDFGKRYDKYVSKRSKTNRKELRTIKLVAEAVIYIVKNNTKKYTTAALNEICLKVYNKIDTAKRVQVYNMLNNPPLKQEVEQKLHEYYLSKGIKPLEKVQELTQKAEDNCKTTSDYMRVAEHFMRVVDTVGANTTVTQRETIDYANLASEDSDNPQLVEQKRTVTRTVTQQITPNAPDNSAKE